jgi:hypothetical protein
VIESPVDFQSTRRASPGSELALRDRTSNLTFDEALDQKEVFGEQVRSAVAPLAATYGIEVSRVAVKDVTMPATGRRPSPFGRESRVPGPERIPLVGFFLTTKGVFAGDASVRLLASHRNGEKLSGTGEYNGSHRMRLSVMIGVAVLGMALLVGSGAGQAPDKKAKGFLPAGWKDLDLTAAQKEQAYKVLGEFKTKMNELKDQEKKLRDEERRELGKILTEEQKKKLVGDSKKTDEKKAEDKK